MIFASAFAREAPSKEDSSRCELLRQCSDGDYDREVAFRQVNFRVARNTREGDSGIHCDSLESAMPI